MVASEQTRDVQPMLVQCWPIVFDPSGLFVMSAIEIISMMINMPRSDYIFYGPGSNSQQTQHGELIIMSV